MSQHLSFLHFEKAYATDQGQNRTREIRPSGIAGRLWETSAKEELGTHSTIERVELVTLLLRCYAPSFYPDKRGGT